jgi:hypothetical protein
MKLVRYLVPQDLRPRMMGRTIWKMNKTMLLWTRKALLLEMEPNLISCVRICSIYVYQRILIIQLFR